MLLQYRSSPCRWPHETKPPARSASTRTAGTCMCTVAAPYDRRPQLYGLGVFQRLEHDDCTAGDRGDVTDLSTDPQIESCTPRNHLTTCQVSLSSSKYSIDMGSRSPLIAVSTQVPIEETPQLQAILYRLLGFSHFVLPVSWVANQPQAHSVNLTGSSLVLH